MQNEFPKTVSYNRFTELMKQNALPLFSFLKNESHIERIYLNRSAFQNRVSLMKKAFEGTSCLLIFGPFHLNLRSVHPPTCNFFSTIL